MSVGEVEREVRDLVARTTKRNVSQLSDEDDIVDRLGVDSLAGLRVLAALEKEFGVRIPNEELGKIRTIRQLLGAIDRWKEEETS
jgi:acyl carrier protein